MMTVLPRRAAAGEQAIASRARPVIAGRTPLRVLARRVGELLEDLLVVRLLAQARPRAGEVHQREARAGRVEVGEHDRHPLVVGEPGKYTSERLAAGGVGWGG